MLKLTQYCLVLALAMLPGTALAQKSEKAQKRGIRFICTAIAEDSSEILKLLGKDGIQDVELNTRAPGTLFEIASEGVILLGEETGDPEKPIKALAKGKMPAKASRATALLIPVKEQEDGTKYEMFVIADGGLKGGSAYFLNLTQNTCIARIDGKDLKMNPGKPVIFQPENLSEARNSRIAIMVETREDDKTNWRPLMSSTWRLRSTRIELCIVYWNDEINRPAIKGLTLFPIGAEELN